MLRDYVSAPRLERYLIACNQDQELAVKLYSCNLRLAQTFHPLLGMLEVFLRNALDRELSSHFQDDDWILNQQNGFMIHPSLQYRHKKVGHGRKNLYLLNSVKRAIQKIESRGQSISSGRVIAEQSFGFWTEFFEKQNYRILQGRPIRIFPYLAAGMGRAEMLAKLNRIRRFRNRIHHNEPICFSSDRPAVSFAQSIHSDILSVMACLGHDVKNYAESLDDFIDRRIEFEHIFQDRFDERSESQF